MQTLALLTSLLAGLLCLLSLTQADLNKAMFRTYFGCKSCDEVSCPPRAEGCELVKERGICACCKVCAQEEGEACGIFTAPCGGGLKCQPVPGLTEKSSQLGSLLGGSAVCVRYTPDINDVAYGQRERRYDAHRRW